MSYLTYLIGKNFIKRFRHQSQEDLRPEEKNIFFDQAF